MHNLRVEGLAAIVFIYIKINAVSYAYFRISAAINSGLSSSASCCETLHWKSLSFHRDVSVLSQPRHHS